MKYNINTVINQDEIITGNENVLIDKTKAGRDRNWKGRKMANELLALAYDVVDIKKAARLRECGKFLTFKVFSDGEKKLDSMASCRVRLCPICAWRRQIKVFSNTMRCLQQINDKREKAYIFLTLTVKNCYGESLTNMIDSMFSAWNRFSGYNEFKDAFSGWFRGLEITHNVNYESKDFDTFHPHFHVMLHVKSGYFGRNYISQKRFCELWQRALMVDYLPVCDVKKTYNSDPKSVAEVAKYSVKTNDFILTDDWDLTVETVKILDRALNNRRLVAYGGTLREAYKELKLEDETDGDLVDVGLDDSNKEDKNFYLQTYFWHTGYSQYYKTE